MKIAIQVKMIKINKKKKHKIKKRYHDRKIWNLNFGNVFFCLKKGIFNCLAYPKLLPQHFELSVQWKTPSSSCFLQNRSVSCRHFSFSSNFSMMMMTMMLVEFYQKHQTIRSIRWNLLLLRSFGTIRHCRRPMPANFEPMAKDPDNFPDSSETCRKYLIIL